MRISEPTTFRFVRRSSAKLFRKANKSGNRKLRSVETAGAVRFGCYARQSSTHEGSIQVLNCPIIGDVRFHGSERWPRVVLHKKLRPPSRSFFCASCQSSVSVDSLCRIPSRSRYRIHQNLDPFRRKTVPSCSIGLAILHLLSERSAEGHEIRLEKPDIAAHYAEMGNLLSLDPKTWTGSG